MKWNKFFENLQYALLYDVRFDFYTSKQILEFIQNCMSSTDYKRYSNLLMVSLNMSVKQLSLIDVNEQLEVKKLELDLKDLKLEDLSKNE